MGLVGPQWGNSTLLGFPENDIIQAKGSGRGDLMQLSKQLHNTQDHTCMLTNKRAG